MPETPDIDAAIEQLAEFFGFQAHYDFTVDGEPFRITYRQFLPADIEKRLQEVEVAVKDCDREEITLPTGKKIKGPGYAAPLARSGKPLPDGFDAMRLIALWGEEKYRRYEAAGKPPGILTAVWAKQDAQYEAWRRAGSKSGARDRDLEA